jgi:hypothetical protein
MATTSVDPTPVVTWRDAVTPLGRASRRRWTIAYAALLALLAASIVDDTFAIERSGSQATPLVALVAVPVVFGMLRRGTRRITALDHPQLDERDVAARNAAYRIALPLLALVVVGALILVGFAAPSDPRRVALGGNSYEEIGGVFVSWEALVGLGVWIALWAVFLPTGVLAWREPDALDGEAAAGRLPEALRDGLLGLALAGGVVASLAADSDVGLLAFVAALALLGALGRRASGQAVMSRERRWRVAIGVVMILVVVLIGVIGARASGGGGASSGAEPTPVRVR